MTRTRVTRTIDAPPERVFRVIADIRRYSKAQPDIVDVEFLSDSEYGVGTRFRETRRMGKRETTTELEVTELVENDRVRIVSDAGGTVWDSQFTVRGRDGGTELTLVMEARPHRLLARITTPLMAGMLRRALEKDMDAVKAYCESGSDRSPRTGEPPEPPGSD